MSVVRAFVAVRLDDAIRSVLGAAADTIREGDHHWRGQKWVEPENLHITLKFLGNLEADAVEGMADILAEECRSLRAFDLVLAEIRAVPNRRDARMLWATFHDADGECGLLAAAAERAALAVGVAPDERAFHPHATLVRARKPRAVLQAALDEANVLAGESHSTMSVPAATVFSSELTPHGPIYTVVRSASLAPR